MASLIMQGRPRYPNVSVLTAKWIDRIFSACPEPVEGAYGTVRYDWLSDVTNFCQEFLFGQDLHAQLLRLGELAARSFADDEK